MPKATRESRRAVPRIARQPRPRPVEASPLFNGSLAKGLAVLMAFGAERRTMNLPDIATATGIGKSAAQRFAYTLEALGFLRKDPASKRYALSPKALELGLRYIHADALVERTTPYLFDLNRKCGETVNLSEPDGTDMVFVARFPGHSKIAVHMPLGRRLPMFCTASGRSYLSARPETELEAILAGTALVAYTPKTVVDPSQLRELVKQTQHDGFALADEEYYRGDVNVAAPLLGDDGWAVAAINVSVPLSRWSPEAARQEIAPLVIETARAISIAAPVRAAARAAGM